MNLFKRRRDSLFFILNSGFAPLIWGVVAAIAISPSAHAGRFGIIPTRQELKRQQLLEALTNATSQPLVSAPTPTLPKKLHYFGGPVIGHIHAEVVFWGAGVDQATQAGIGGFITSATASTYMDWLNEYNTDITSVNGKPGTAQVIGRGKLGGIHAITPSHTAKSLLDADIQDELIRQISAGNLPAADADTLYLIYFPKGYSITIDTATSCQEFCGYHMGFHSQLHGDIFYGVMPDMGGTCAFGCGFAPTQFDNLTTVTSHEIIEAVTDPFPCIATKPDYPQGWNTMQGAEIGDLCAGHADKPTRLKSGPTTYWVQQEFSNTLSSCTQGEFESP